MGLQSPSGECCETAGCVGEKWERGSLGCTGLVRSDHWTF